MSESRENPTIIIPPGNFFRWMRQRPHQMAIALAKLGYKIIFGQNLATLSDRVAYLADGPYIQDTEFENLKVCYNIDRYAREHDEKIILLCSSGPGHIWSDRVPHHAIIYDELDNFPVHERRAVEACRKADRILYSAKSLESVINNRRREFPEITDKTFYVPNACDFEYWDFRLKSEEDSLPPFKVMYIGALAVWLDYEFIFEVVRNLPQYEFWFIGASISRSPFTSPYISMLLACPNVVMLSHVMYDELKFFAEDADVFWIPFDVSDHGINLDKTNVVPVSTITQHTNPIKFWEYLATGKPIVHTPMNSLLDFEELMAKAGIAKSDIRIANTSVAQEAIDAIQRFTEPLDWHGRAGAALYHKQMAQEQTWDKVIAVVDDAIQDLMSADLEAETKERAEKVRLRRKDPKNRPDMITIHEPTEPVDLLEDDE